MSITPGWKPSASLAAATSAALQALSRQWPRAMALALEQTDAGHQYMADFAFAMHGASLEAIPLAVRQWIAENSMPPKPHDLGKLAREISREHFPSVYHVTSNPNVPETGRSWEWVDPADDRLRRVEEHRTGWVGIAAEQMQEHGGERQFVAWMDEMVRRYPIRDAA